MNKGWASVGPLSDARIHTAMVFEMTNFPKSAKQVHDVMLFMLWAGYWVRHLPNEGLGVLVRSLGTHNVP